MLCCPQRWSRRKQARPEEILAAALECFVKHGYSATRMEDIAKHAGVTKGTVYLYYANKEELLKAVVRETLLPRVAELEQVLNDTDCSAPELLRRLLQQWGTLVRDNDLVAGLPKLMIGEVSNFPELARFYYEEVICRGRRLVANVLAHGIARGEFRSLNINQAVEVMIAPVIMGMIWQHSFAYFEAKPMDFPHYLDAVYDILLRGLSAPVPSGNSQ